MGPEKEMTWLGPIHWLKGGPPLDNPPCFDMNDPSCDESERFWRQKGLAALPPPGISLREAWPFPLQLFSAAGGLTPPSPTWRAFSALLASWRQVSAHSQGFSWARTGCGPPLPSSLRRSNGGSQGLASGHWCCGTSSGATPIQVGLPPQHLPFLAGPLSMLAIVALGAGITFIMFGVSSFLIFR